MMRATADLTDTARSLERAAARGPAPAETQARLSAWRSLTGDVMARLEAELPRVTEGGPGMAALAARHLLAAGGKRVRPLLVLLAARAAARPAGERAALEQEQALAQAAELVHAATLLHDDVLDDGLYRRGQPAARVLWGNAASVLGGDFLLVRALELTAAARVPGTLDELLAAIGRMIDGEALQLQHRGRADLTPERYHEVVDGKTASLFAWCGRAGARLAGAGPEVVNALGEYGLQLGRAFQIVDDVLDVEGDPQALGKGVLCDLREGKLTLPVLFALEGAPALRARLQAAVSEEHPPEGLVEALAQALRGGAAAARAREVASARTAAAEQALAVLDAEEGPAESRACRSVLSFIARELCARRS
jgi:octaprenyl-diphosphate synthase